MKTSFLRQNVFPVLAAFIWGTSFAAQDIGAEYVPGFTFTALRSVIAAVFLCVIAMCAFALKKKGIIKSEGIKSSKKDIISGSIICGAVLFTASNFQQFGITNDTDSGKAGFITALYVVIVPVLGLFLKKKAPLNVWISIVFAVVGFYFLCIKDGFTITKGDFLVLICAFAYAIHILVIDAYTEKIDGIILSCGQFTVNFILSAICMLMFENPVLENIKIAMLPILYVGIMSSGIAYTLQILAQKNANPSVVTLLLSLESVFAVLTGVVLLGEKFSGREALGCILVFAGVLLAQFKIPSIKKKEKSYEENKAL